MLLFWNTWDASRVFTWCGATSSRTGIRQGASSRHCSNKIDYEGDSARKEVSFGRRSLSVSGLNTLPVQQTQQMTGDDLRPNT